MYSFGVFGYFLSHSKKQDAVEQVSLWGAGEVPVLERACSQLGQRMSVATDGNHGT